MKPFKFKLDGLLKIRAMKEERVKVELGMILKNIKEFKDKIKSNNLEILEAHKSIEVSLKSNTKAELIQFFPQFIEAKMADNSNLDNQIYSLEKKYEEKLKELTNAIGDREVISKLKDKKMDEYKKLLSRKEDIKLDDMNIIRIGCLGDKNG